MDYYNRAYAISTASFIAYTPGPNFISVTTKVLLEVHINENQKDKNRINLDRPGDTLIFSGMVIRAVPIEGGFTLGTMDIEKAFRIAKEEEQREFPRLALRDEDKPSIILMPEDKKIKISVVDFTASGMGGLCQTKDISSKALLEEGSVLTAQIILPNAGSENEEISLKYKIIENKLFGEQIKIGCKVGEITKGDREKIIAHVNKSRETIAEIINEFLDALRGYY